MFRFSSTDLDVFAGSALSEQNSTTRITWVDETNAYAGFETIAQNIANQAFMDVKPQIVQFVRACLANCLKNEENFGPQYSGQSKKINNAVSVSFTRSDEKNNICDVTIFVSRKKKKPEEELYFVVFYGNQYLAACKQGVLDKGLPQKFEIYKNLGDAANFGSRLFLMSQYNFKDIGKVVVGPLYIGDGTIRYDPNFNINILGQNYVRTYQSTTSNNAHPVVNGEVIGDTKYIYAPNIKLTIEPDKFFLGETYPDVRDKEFPYAPLFIYKDGKFLESAGVGGAIDASFTNGGANGGVSLNYYYSTLYDPQYSPPGSIIGRAFTASYAIYKSQATDFRFEYYGERGNPEITAPDAPTYSVTVNDALPLPEYSQTSEGYDVFSLRPIKFNGSATLNFEITPYYKSETSGIRSMSMDYVGDFSIEYDYDPDREFSSSFNGVTAQAYFIGFPPTFINTPPGKKLDLFEDTFGGTNTVYLGSTYMTPYETLSSEYFGPITENTFPRYELYGWLHVSNGKHFLQGYASVLWTNTNVKPDYTDVRKAWLYLNGSSTNCLPALAQAIGCNEAEIKGFLMDFPGAVLKTLK